MLIAPHALLLDFGGVLADAPGQDHAPAALVQRLHELTGGVLTPAVISQALFFDYRAHRPDAKVASA